MKEETIQKCFRKTGVIDEDFNPLTLVDNVDPFAEADCQLQNLVTRSMPTSESCSVEEYTDGK